jgi:two-component system LytT family response regulator
MKKLNCVIVNQSLDKRNSLKELIDQHPELNLIACFRNAIEAVEGINCREVDLAIIAIEMPIRNGFQLIESLENQPQIIIASEKSDYALKAFEYNVTDYLLGEIEIDRFNIAIDKALKIHTNSNSIDENEPCIFIHFNQRKKRIRIRDIKWIEAMGDYSKIITDRQVYTVAKGLKKVMDMISSSQMLRIHKSFVVNLDKIQSYSTTSVVIENISLPISRANKQAFIQALQAS